MMKKLFLLFASCAVAAGANAQVANSSMVRLSTRDMNSARPQSAHVQSLGKAGTATANKGTGVTKRTYNYVDYLALLNPDVINDDNYSNAPYLWFNNDIYGIYQGTSGLERDTINLTSYGAVLHPYWAGYNDPTAYTTPTMAVTTTNTYTVDSVYAYGIYGRNPAKQSIVDTLRFAITYGNGSGTSNLPQYYYTGMMANYGYDTVRAAIPSYDVAKHTIGKPSGSTGPSIIYKDVLLHAADTSTVNYKAIGIAPAMIVPAGGNLVAVSVTFRSGEVYAPNSDTAFVGSVNAAVPFKYGMFRPLIIMEDLSAFPTYTPGNYNVGQFETLPETATDPTYSPTWAWTTNSGASPASYQFPYIDFVVSCAACYQVNVANISAATIGNAYPNPANNTVTLPITMKENAQVNVTLSNVVGQVVATQNLGQVAAKQTKDATFTTANLAGGVYLVTVEANGARSTSRIVVAH